jgi:hypothetical protein
MGAKHDICLNKIIQLEPTPFSMSPRPTAPASRPLPAAFPVSSTSTTTLSRWTGSRTVPMSFFPPQTRCAAQKTRSSRPRLPTLTSPSFTAATAASTSRATAASSLFPSSSSWQTLPTLPRARTSRGSRDLSTQSLGSATR